MKIKEKKNTETGIPLGLVFGVVFGVVMDNIAIGIALGIAFGLLNLFDTRCWVSKYNLFIYHPCKKRLDNR